MEFRRLFHPVHDFDLRQDDPEDSAGGKQPERQFRIGSREHHGQFIPDPFRRKQVQFSRQFPDGVRNCGIQRETEPRREPDRPEHPQVIFRKTSAGIADGPDNAAPEIGKPPRMIDDAAVFRVIKQRVDREIPPGYIFFGRLAVMQCFRTAAVHIIPFLTECRHFKIMAVLHYGYHSE